MRGPIIPEKVLFTTAVMVNSHAASGHLTAEDLTNLEDAALGIAPFWRQDYIGDFARVCRAWCQAAGGGAPGSLSGAGGPLGGAIDDYLASQKAHETAAARHRPIPQFSHGIEIG